MIKTEECWWCHRPSDRPLCPGCSTSSAARRHIKMLIRGGATKAPAKDVRPAGRRASEHRGKRRTSELAEFIHHRQKETVDTKPQP